MSLSGSALFNAPSNLERMPSDSTEGHEELFVSIIAKDDTVMNGMTKPEVFDDWENLQEFFQRIQSDSQSKHTSTHPLTSASSDEKFILGGDCRAAHEDGNNLPGSLKRHMHVDNVPIKRAHVAHCRKGNDSTSAADEEKKRQDKYGWVHSLQSHFE